MRYNEHMIGISKRYLAAMGAATVVFIFAGTVRSAGDLFFDDFETGTFAAWTSADTPPWLVQGTTAHSGVKRATAAGPGSGAIMKQQSTEGFQNIRLSYWYRIQQGLEDDDHVLVEWSTDGDTWRQITDHTGPASGSFKEAIWVLPASASDQATFQFRFSASLSNSSDVLWLDDVRLAGEAIPTPTPPPPPTPTPTPTAPLNPDPILNESTPANPTALSRILRNISRWLDRHDS